jgi:hypothetical protein
MLNRGVNVPLGDKVYPLGAKYTLGVNFAPGSKLMLLNTGFCIHGLRVSGVGTLKSIPKLT